MVIEHGEGKRCDEAAVRAIPEPEFTNTWHPFGHGKVLNCLDKAVQDHGLVIKDKSYTLTADGKNMFGTWGLDGGTDEIGWQLGFRNSVRKTFAIGITAGTNVFVCSNMAFSGEFLEFRRHTNQLDEEEIHQISNRAIDQLIEKIQYQVDWQMNLREHKLSNQDFKILTYDALDRGAFSSGKFRQFLNCHKEETDLAGDQTLYTWHGAGTRLMRGVGLFQLANQTTILQAVADDYLIAKAA